MGFLFVKYDDNWADEFDVEAFKIFDEESYHQMLASAKESLDEEPNQEIYYGTNEYFMVDSYEDFFGNLTVKEISESEKAAIEKFIGNSYGFTNIFNW